MVKVRAREPLDLARRKWPPDISMHINVWQINAKFARWNTKVIQSNARRNLLPLHHFGLEPRQRAFLARSSYRADLVGSYGQHLRTGRCVERHESCARLWSSVM